ILVYYISCLSIHNVGSGLVFELTSVLVDPNTKVQYTKIRSQTFVIGYGGFGGPKGKKSVSYAPPKNKAPDAVVSAKTLATQALLYRLSGYVGHYICCKMCITC